MNHTPGPWDYNRGFRDTGNYPGDHYTIADDFITVYIGKESIDDFDPEKHDWAEIHGPNQEANARLIVQACNSHTELLEALEQAKAALNLVYGHHCFTEGQKKQISKALRHSVKAIRKAREG